MVLLHEAVDGEAGSPLMDDACIPVDIDMTLSIMRSIKTSSTTLFAVQSTCSTYTLRVNNIRFEGYLRHSNEIESRSTMITV
jgi:hypothetical protein